MHIALSVDGGLASFPGLRRPVTLDTAALPPEHAARICALVADADFFHAAPAACVAGAADQRTYVVEIHDGARRRTLSLTEPIGDPRLRDLVHAIRDCAGTTPSR